MGKEVVLNKPGDIKTFLDERSPTPEEKNVAIHEMEHAIVALACGIGVEEVSIIPTSQYQGITKFSPTAVMDNTYDFLSVVMASSVDIPGTYSPDGLAGDNFQAKRLSYLIGGDSSTLIGAKMRASMILSTFGFDLLEKCADILTKRKSLNGAELIEVITKAKEELKIEKELPFIYETYLKAEPNTSDYSIALIENSDGKVKIVKEYKCCKGISGHMPGCPVSEVNIKTEEPSASSQSQDQTVFEFGKNTDLDESHMSQKPDPQQNDPQLLP